MSASRRTKQLRKELGRNPTLTEVMSPGARKRQDRIIGRQEAARKRAEDRLDAAVAAAEARATARAIRLGKTKGLRHAVSEARLELAKERASRKHKRGLW